ncbi:zf-HC2 domain-containing protein [Flavitalea sp.]|nr:zf-HC2 domain-containing protein [Flavitalea sp.]
MMKCNDVLLLLIDYLDNELPQTSRTALELHLNTCESCSRELMEYKEIFSSIAGQHPVLPGIGLKENFDTMLQSEINILATTRIIDPIAEKAVPLLPIRNILMKIAACILLIAGGVVIGSVVTRSKSENETTAQMAGLKTEVKEMKEAIMLNLLNDESASERIKAVTYVEQMNNPGEDVIRALINTLNLDQNVNVRLAALNTVSRFTSNQTVRDSLVNSLRQQKEPIVQIVLINILTDKKEVKAIGPIKEILSDKSTLPPVKDAASKGLKLL